MLTIRLSRLGEPVFSTTLHKTRIVLGRAPTCDLRLDDPTLSREHCALTYKNDRWIIEDLSKNGVYLETPAGESDEDAELRIEKAALKENQTYRLGRLFTMTASWNHAPSSQEKTLVLGNRPTQFLKIDSEKNEVILGNAQLEWSDPETGERKQRPLAAQGLTLGAHDSNDLCLPFDDVSQFHAQIEYTANNEFVITDLNSTNGISVNDVRVQRGILETASTIRFGSCSLKFVVDKKEVSLKPKKTHQFMDLVSTNAKMKKAFALVEAVSGTDAAVCIHGETGTGKELLSRAVHEFSQRFRGPFVAINCAALAKDVVESELFGHEKGAFTGATAQRIGAFEAANGGTLFLDEIADLHLDIQAKLLRALENGEIRRLGSNQTIKVSVRIVSASNRNLKDEVAQQRFREDLYFRLHVVPIELPPLRDRMEDLEVLIPHLLKKINPEIQMDKRLTSVLKNYSFPGNVRELRNILQRACVELEMKAGGPGASKVLRPTHFHFVKGLNFVQYPSATEIDPAERKRIINLLLRHQFNQTKVAALLKIPPSTLHDKLKRLGLNRQNIQAAALSVIHAKRK